MQARVHLVAVVATAVASYVVPTAFADPVDAQPVAIAPAVTLAQAVEPKVVLRPLDDARLSSKGTDLFRISAVGSNDVPEAALRAYRTAAATMARTAPACEMPWTLLAGIGRVESDHGRYGGSVLGADGVPRPAIRGVALNGVGPVAAIHDTDNGRFDGDTVWDRAVGPMQFIPSTWDYAGRDGDRDGVASPNDIDDAALAAADYLCPASGSVLSADAMRASIFRYNHSDYYVDLVMAFERGYRTGSFVLPSPPPAEEPADEKRAKKRKRKSAPVPVPVPAPNPRPAPSTGPKPQPEPQPERKPEPKPEPGPKPEPKPKPPKAPKPPKTSAPTPTPAPTPSPEVAVEPTDQPAA